MRGVPRQEDKPCGMPIPPFPGRARSGNTLTGRMCPPGDKSIFAFRALILGLLCIGENEGAAVFAPRGDGTCSGALPAACRAGSVLQATPGRLLMGALGASPAPGSAACTNRRQVLDFGNAGTGFAPDDGGLAGAIPGDRHPSSGAMQTSLRKRRHGARILRPRWTRNGRHRVSIRARTAGACPLTAQGPARDNPDPLPRPPSPRARSKSRHVLARGAECAGHLSPSSRTRPAARPYRAQCCALFRRAGERRSPTAKAPGG